MTQGNDFGCLGEGHEYVQERVLREQEVTKTYLTKEPANAAGGVISLPLVSRAFSTLNVANVEAIISQMLPSPNHRPGQALKRA